LARNLNEVGAVRAAISLVTLAFFAPIATGCISNEYVIPRDELRRLAVTPPEQRGQRVHVIQDLGSRRMDAIPTDGPNWPQAAPWPQPYAEPPPEETETRDTDVALGLHGNIYIAPGGHHHHLHSGGNIPTTGGAQAWRGSPPTGPGMTPAGGSWQGKPPSGGAISGWRGAPPGSSGGGSSSWRGVPASGSGRGSSGGGSLGNIGSGGGGGNGGEAMVVLAVVLAVIAVVMTVSLVGSEGIRFDGMAQMSPWQPVHLKQRGGGELVIALGDLSPVAIEGAVEAKVMDDEGYGIRTLDHLRLDRRWAPTFKLDAGSMTFARSGTVRSGFISNMQVGLFVRPWLGLMLTAAVGGAGDEYGATITRHVFGFEAQSLPLALGPVQLGGYVNVGAAAIASTATGSGPVEWGNAIGAGILGELQVTSRMALTLRAGANEAFFANSGTTSPAATVTAGLALY
jgi:hypothetical protein